MELKRTGRFYPCNDTNYYVGNYNGENYGQKNFSDWENFKKEWESKNGNRDHFFCFRYDIVDYFDEVLEEEIEGRYSLKLYFVQQNKGNFIPVIIKEITKEDMKEVEDYLRSCWGSIQEMWEEINNEKSI